MQMLETRSIRPARRVTGTIRLPGDKSISHRYAMLAAMAEGVTTLENYPSGADCASTLRCISSLGVQVTEEGGKVSINGSRLSRPASPLDCGNSGSTMRMLAGILSAQPFASELRGDDSLSRRPMMRVIEPLTRMGALIESSSGRAPLKISPNTAGLKGIHYEMPVASAQVKTAILFAGVFASGKTSIGEPIRTRDHGELALRAFGAEVSRERNRVSLEGGQTLKAIEAAIPGDISSASFFLCAAAVLPGSTLVIQDISLNPTRAGLLDVLTGLGVQIRVLRVEEKQGELVGNLQVEHSNLGATKISGAMAARLIDEIPVLAAIAPYSSGGIEIRDAGELRVKESDRIVAIAANLRKMGAEVMEHDDGLSVPGNQRLHGAELDAAGDHRIAMAFAISALRAEGETVVHGADVAAISFPEFWTILDSVVER